LEQIRSYLPGVTSAQIQVIDQATVDPPPPPETASRSFRQWGHDVTLSMRSWFINQKHDIQNNFVVQIMSQFGQLARSTGNFIYILPLISSLYIIKKHIDWARRVMGEHPTYRETGDPPRKEPPTDPRNPRGDGSGSARGISVGGKRKKTKRRKTKRKKRKTKRRKRREKRKTRRKKRTY
jgi:hypothetical protein